MKVALGEVCTARSSLVDPTTSEVAHLPHIGPDAIERDTGRLLEYRTAREDAVTSGKYRFEAGDVLYSKIRPNLNKVVQVSFDGLCSADMYALEVDHARASPEFLVRVLRSSGFLGYANRLSNRANIPKLNRDQLMRFEFVLPPLPEQLRIARILDRADRIRTKRRHVLAHLDSLTQSTFHTMFGELQDWKWPTDRVDALGKVQLGRQRSPKYQTGQWTYPYMRVANVQLGRLDLRDVLSMDFAPADFAAYRLEIGDILLNEGQNTEWVGRPAMWRGEIPDCCFQNTLLRFQADRDRVLPEFALHVFLEFLRTGQFARISSKTSNVAHLGRSRFAAMQMPVPPLSTQAKFAEYVEVVRTTASGVTEAVAAHDGLFATLEARAFRGEL